MRLEGPCIFGHETSERILQMTLPAKLKYIDIYAFNECTALKKVLVSTRLLYLVYSHTAVSNRTGVPSPLVTLRFEPAPADPACAVLLGVQS